MPSLMKVSNKFESNEWLNKSITTSHDFQKKKEKEIKCFSQNSLVI